LRPAKSGQQAPKKDHSMSICEAAIVKDATLASHYAIRSDGYEAAIIKGQVLAHAVMSTDTTAENLRSGAA
jgi:hypothetical protein